MCIQIHNASQPSCIMGRDTPLMIGQIKSAVIHAKVTADQVSYALKLALNNDMLGGGTRDSLHHSILKKLSSILSTSQSECTRRGQG